MELKDIKPKKVLYFMQSFVITAGGTDFEVPRTMIINVDIAKNYDEMIYPMWYVSTNVPLWFYAQVNKNPDDVSVTMNLQYTLAETNEKLVESTNPMTTEVSGKFKAVIPSTTQVGDYTNYKNFENNTNSYDRNYSFNEYAILELSLYNSAAYQASFKSINAVLTSTNMTNAATYCFNQCGINNILLSKADNNTNYSEFKILPMSGIKNLMRIVEDYKFHNEGSTLFFDLTESYLITNKIGCYAWKNNEYKSTYFISASEYKDSAGRIDGICTNTKEKYNVISIQRNGYQSQKIDDTPIIKETGETEVFRIATNHAIMSMITPNKEFIVNIDSPDNKKYNGKYRLRTMSVNMTPKGEYLEPYFEIILIR